MKDGTVKVRYQLLVSAFAAAMLASTAASAATVVVNNSSFEEVQLHDGEYRAGSAPGWQVGGNVGWQNPTTRMFPTVPDGANTAWIGGQANLYAAGSLYQTFAQSTAANTQYVVNVDIGRRADLALAPFVVELLSGATVVASGTYTEADLAPGEFRNFSLTYDALQGSNLPLMLRYRVTQATQAYTQVNFDNVRIEANSLASAVPEPATWAMMIVGFGTAGSMVRSARRRDLAAARA
jgi:hypothetical protein